MMKYLEKFRYSIVALLICILITLTTGGNALALVPTIDSITPASGWNNFETEVTINGSNFEEGAEVSIATILSSVDISYACDVYILENYAYVVVEDWSGGGLYIIDISTPKYPSIVGFVGLAGPLDLIFSGHEVYVSGNYAYVVGTIYIPGSYHLCLKVIDISDPTNPFEVGSYDSLPVDSTIGSGGYGITSGWTYAPNIYVSGNYAYMTSTVSSLIGTNGNFEVIDISDPTAPYKVGDLPNIGTIGPTKEVYISGDYVYVASCAGTIYSEPIDPGLQVIDISDPANPSVIGSVDTPDYAYGVYISGSYAYVAAGDSGLQVVDISDPINPSIVAYIDTPGSAKDVHVSGSYVYVDDDISGLQVITIPMLSDSNVVGSTTITATIPPYLPESIYDIIVKNPGGEIGILEDVFRLSDGIVDNSDPEFSLIGDWGTSSGAPSFFGRDFQYHAPGDGLAAATWPAELPAGAGSYEVFIWYPIFPLFAANAPFTINHAGGSNTILVNQGINGGQWVSLGVYEFANNGSENVTLTDDADTWVAADAVAFEIPGTLPPPQPPDGIVDNLDPKFSVTGIWGTALRTVVPGVYGADFRYHAAGDGTETTTWPAELSNGPGYYEVKIRYPISSLLATNAPFTINHNGESETILVDQSRNGGQCLSLGIYYFADDGTENITLSDNADSWVVADVVCFTPTSPPSPPDGIVDNFDPKFSLTGTWPTSNTTKVPDFYGIDFRYHAAGDGSETARWDTELITGPGLYEVFVWYPKSTLLASNAAYTINHNGTSDTVPINQGVNGGQWVSLGSYEFADNGTENIILSDNTDSWVVADAVRFELLTVDN